MKKEFNWKSIYDIGIYLLTFLLMVVLVSTLGFIFGFKLEKWQIPCSYILTTVVIAYLNKDKNEGLLKYVVLISIISLCIIGISVVASGLVYDLSYDGNTYHKTTIGMLRYGWNPVYESFESAVARTKVIPEINWPIWYDHYPKASWIIGGAFYSLTGNIEVGKCMSIIMIISAGCILAYFLYSIKLFKNWQISLLSFLSVVTVVSIPQLQSYYNDGMMGNLIICALAALLLITFEVEKTKKTWFILVCSIALAVNIKYSGLVYMGSFCFAFFIYWIFQTYKIDGKEKGNKKLICLTSFYIATLIFSVILIGASSYVRNTVEHGNPLYTVIGKDNVQNNITTYILPKSYDDMSNINQFFHSLFSETSNLGYESEEQPALKIPFTLSKEELKMGSFFDARVGGYGVLFSGIFIISCIIISYSLILLRKNNRVAFNVTSIILIVFILQIILIPGFAMARYFPYHILLPVYSLGTIFYLMRFQDKKVVCSFICIVLITTMLANLSNYIYYDIERFKESRNMTSDLDYLNKLAQKEKIEICTLSGFDFQGFLFNLKDAGVDYYRVVDTMDEDYITTFNWRLGYRVIK